MECFYHPDVAAAGVCKNCQRGICRDCIAEVADAISCTGRCESQAAGMGKMWRLGPKTYGGTAAYMLAFGVILMASAIRNYQEWKEVEIIPLGMGVVFLVAGAGFAVAAFKMRRTKE